LKTIDEESTMTRIMIGGIVAGILLFFWGFVSHMLLSIGEMGLQAIPHEEGMAAAMKQAVPEPGLYFLPGYDRSKPQTEEDMRAHMEKVTKGPYGFMVLYPAGRDVSLGKRLPIEFGTNVVCALLAAIVVSQLRPGFFVRVGCVTLIGILASIMILVPYWNWYGFPADFTLGQLVEHAVGWFLAGIALAAIVKPTAATKPQNPPMA
jgi:hypothetical protein